MPGTNQKKAAPLPGRPCKSWERMPERQPSNGPCAVFVQVRRARSRMTEMQLRFRLWPALIITAFSFSHAIRGEADTNRSTAFPVIAQLANNRAGDRVPDLLKTAPKPVKSGRDERIRTSDPHTPSVMRYQAALRPDRGLAFRSHGRLWQETSDRMASWHATIAALVAETAASIAMPRHCC